MADAITVHCPSCETAFPVDPEKVPEGGVNARCSECEDIFRVDSPHPGVGGETEAVGDFGEAAELPGFDVSEPRSGAEEEVEGGADEGEDEDGEEGWAEEYFSTSGPVEEGVDEADGTATAGFPELEDEPGIAGPELDTGEVETPEVEGVGSEGDAGLDMESTEIETEATAEALDEPAPPETPKAHEGEFGEIEVGAVVEEEEEERETEGEPARAAFGNRSPEEKAQRLARVLVSDMITYNPSMYETALARGTLEEDFAEEIEKSWEEYVEQVGEELATSTSHWTDALNDILAKGEKTF